MVTSENFIILIIGYGANVTSYNMLQDLLLYTDNITFKRCTILFSLLYRKLLEFVFNYLLNYFTYMNYLLVFTI